MRQTGVGVSTAGAKSGETAAESIFGLVSRARDAAMPGGRALAVDQQAESASRLEEFLGVVVDLAGAHGGALRGLAADGEHLRLVAAVGLPADLREREAVVGMCGICGDAVRHDDIRVRSGLQFCAERTSTPFFGETCRRAVAVPLDYKGGPIGVLTLFFDGDTDIASDVYRYLRPLGQLLGLTLENDKLARENLHARVIGERQAMASEIHDSLAQSLAFIRMRMSVLQNALRDDDVRKAAKCLNDVNEELGSTHRRLRELITHFRAGMDGQGLMRSLQETAATFLDRTGIDLALDVENRVSELGLPAEVEIQVYRIVQEALSNVRKHSNARHARVRVERRPEALEITVEDDGRGMAAQAGSGAKPRRGGRREATTGHFGLDIMRERAASMGGMVEFENIASGGTRVRLSVPTEGQSTGAGDD